VVLDYWHNWITLKAKKISKKQLQIYTPKPWKRFLKMSFLLCGILLVPDHGQSHQIERISLQTTTILQNLFRAAHDWIYMKIALSSRTPSTANSDWVWGNPVDEPQILAVHQLAHRRPHPHQHLRASPQIRNKLASCNPPEISNWHDRKPNRVKQCMARYLDGGLIVGWRSGTTRHRLQAPPKGHTGYLLDEAMRGFPWTCTPSWMTHGAGGVRRGGATTRQQRPAEARPLGCMRRWRRAASSCAAAAEDDDASLEADGCPTPRVSGTAARVRASGGEWWDVAGEGKELVRRFFFPFLRLCEGTTGWAGSPASKLMGSHRRGRATH
jgi:hypothetical protein